MLFVTGYLSSLLMKSIEYMMVKRMAEVEDAFKLFDVDGSGTLSAREYKQAHKQFDHCLWFQHDFLTGQESVIAFLSDRLLARTGKP